jgi:hydroxymethylglutaryl-CoA synthase
LEQYNSVSQGKYTVGLGQLGLAFVNDREDVYSMALTAVDSFMRQRGLSYADIGRLEVGSETIVDHSKSIKSVLMQLFVSSGNSDVEGVDSINACYAGTHALFNSLDWIESSSFDGRYALVVAADIAEYAAGPARPTGGAAVVVLLLGPNAPLPVDRGCRSSHMEHCWDFYKPNMQSPYPLVDGHHSNLCYLRALDRCYSKFMHKWQQRQHSGISLHDGIDRIVFHAPYNKLTQKAFARLYWNDYQLALTAADANTEKVHARYPTLAPFSSLSVAESYTDISLEKALLALSKPTYDSMVRPSTLLPQQVGNMYTASLYAGLISLVYTAGRELAGKRILCFSYGSGLAASVFSITVPQSAGDKLAALRDSLDLKRRLSERVEKSCEEFSRCMEHRESLHSLPSFTAQDSIEDLRQHTWYLTEKDANSRRQYRRKGGDDSETVRA